MGQGKDLARGATLSSLLLSLLLLLDPHSGLLHPLGIGALMPIM